jgi:hypothetical protein
MDPRKFPSSYHGWLHRNEKGWEEAEEAAVVDTDAVEKNTSGSAARWIANLDRCLRTRKSPISHGGNRGTHRSLVR